jgi:hypothetical protein
MRRASADDAGDRRIVASGPESDRRVGPNVVTRRRAPRAVRATSALVVGVALLLTAGACGDDAPDPASQPSVPTAAPGLALEPGSSGAFAVRDLPDGFEIARADADETSGWRSLTYEQGGDDDLPGWTISAGPLAEAEQRFDEIVERARQQGGDHAFEEVEVRGLPAYLGPSTDDGRVIGSSIVWEERPGLVVEVRVRDGAGVDPVDLASRTYEISDAAFGALVTGTNSGGVAGARIEAVTGDVDGDRYVLTAVLPDGYPVEPIDRRAGCMELAYRGETATTCDDQMAFGTLDDAAQAVLGGVNFAFGVFRDGSAEVVVAPVETPAGPWEAALASVVPEAPELTWFVLSFPEVCDRDAVSGGGLNQGIGVPPGYPHSRCD